MPGTINQKGKTMTVLMDDLAEAGDVQLVSVAHCYQCGDVHPDLQGSHCLRDPKPWTLGEWAKIWAELALERKLMNEGWTDADIQAALDSITVEVAR